MNKHNQPKHKTKNKTNKTARTYLHAVNAHHAPLTGQPGLVQLISVGPEHCAPPYCGAGHAHTRVITPDVPHVDGLKKKEKVRNETMERGERRERTYVHAEYAHQPPLIAAEHRQ